MRWAGMRRNTGSRVSFSGRGMFMGPADQKPAGEGEDEEDSNTAPSHGHLQGRIGRVAQWVGPGPQWITFAAA